MEYTTLLARQLVFQRKLSFRGFRRVINNASSIRCGLIFNSEKCLRKSPHLIRSNTLFTQKNQIPGDIYKHKWRYDSIEECINHYTRLWDYRISYTLWDFDLESRCQDIYFVLYSYNTCLVVSCFMLYCLFVKLKHTTSTHTHQLIKCKNITNCKLFVKRIM